ncbi:MAG: NAD(P)H-dependent oxidoreductase subunit E [Nitrososphaeraceae archaeon]
MNKKIDTSSLGLKIKNTGFRLTRSRKTILGIIAKTRDDLTAEEIFILAHKKTPGIGIATVYRTIILFEKFNIIEKAHFENNKAKYRIKYNANVISQIQKNKKQKTNPLLISNPDLLEPKRNYSYSSKTDTYQNTIRINNIQTQLNEWANELNKIKSEKEIELEEIINDFGKIDKILEKHEFKENNLIQMLLDFQSEYNWLPKHVLFYTGNKLNITLTQIYSIASFYKFFNLEPRGKYQVIVCAGTACHVRGSINLLQRIINILSIKPGETTRDYKFTLDTVNCLGCCALGPVMVLKDMYYSNPSSKQLEKLFNELD